MSKANPVLRVLTKGLCYGIFVGAVAAANVGAVEPVTVSKDLSAIFPGAPASVNFNSFSSTNSLTGQTVYKELMNDCRGFGNDPNCENKVAFGVVNTTGAPDSQRGMNRMIILSPTGNRRFEDVTVSGGKVQYNASLVRENEIGFINVAYFRGSPSTPFNRCDAEIVVCGNNVVGCPQASANPVCAPVVAKTTAINYNCFCKNPDEVMTSCVNNVADCQPKTSGCKAGETLVGTECKPIFGCDSLTAAEQSTLSSKCKTETAEFTRPGYHPATIYCSGTQTCTQTNCSPGTYKSGDQCIPCEQGTYSPQENMTSCIACGSGTTAPFEGLPSCTSCAAGFYAVDAKQQCKACDAGTYSLGGTSSCTPCQRPNVPGAAVVDVTSPPGATDSSKCSYKVTQCVAGYTLNADGMGCTQNAAPGKCGKGQYLAAGGSCAACPAGTYEDSIDHTNNACKPCSVANGSFPMAKEGATSMFAAAGSTEPSCGELKCNPGMVISADKKSCRALSCPFYAVPVSNSSSNVTGITTYSQFEGKNSGILSDLVHPVPPGASSGTSLDPYVGQCHQYSYNTVVGTCDVYAKWKFENRQYSVNVTPCDQPVFECPSSSVTLEGQTITFPYGETLLYRADIGGEIMARSKYYAWAKVPNGRTTGCGKNNGDACTTPSGNPGKILRISAMQNVPFAVTPPGSINEECVWYPNNYTEEICECIDP